MANFIIPGILIVGVLSLQAHALESIADEALSESVGQDGITISTSVNWLSQSVKVHDLNGVPATLVAGNANAGTVAFNGWGMQGCTNGAGAACTTTTNPTFNILIDATGGAAPFIQMAVNWDAGIGKIRFLLDNISLQNGLGGNNVEIIDLAQGYVDVIRPAGAPALNIQLGNEPGGNMITLASFNVGTLDFGQVLLRDKSDTLVNNRNIRFSFALTGLDLTNTTVNVIPTGLVIGNPSMTGLGFTMTDIIAGNTTTTMGSVGVTNITLTNLSVRISGKS
ncbi:MAG: hypothetical protein Q7T36_15165 [Fluviicoccus sp.]|uniref:DUF6160 family protein n=1 Tax=Fluviicoccus sp. TaxID=2003552 RepID=UPI002725E447|nr:DUF6160 family protein [Fluviicoccus sp.]MDO8331804.1 hypothetical protein [Fluviicoccus sp.]